MNALAASNRLLSSFSKGLSDLLGIVLCFDGLDNLGHSKTIQKCIQ